MLFNLLLKTQHFAIPLSVSITKPKILVVSPFLRMIIKPGKSRKGEKPTSENRRKINGLKASKIEMNRTFFISNFRNFQTITLCFFELQLFYTKHSTVGCPYTTSRKRSKGPVNVLISGEVGLKSQVQKYSVLK